MDYPGNNIAEYRYSGEEINESIDKCQAKCQMLDECSGFTIYQKQKCYLKRKIEVNVTIEGRQFYLSGPKHCPIHGGWSDFELWLPCSPMCGNGTKRRFKFCTNPEPAYGGNHCNGENFEETKCYTDCSQGKPKLNMIQLPEYLANKVSDMQFIHKSKNMIVKQNLERLVTKRISKKHIFSQYLKKHWVKSGSNGFNLKL